VAGGNYDGGFRWAAVQNNDPAYAGYTYEVYGNPTFGES